MEKPIEANKKKELFIFIGTLCFVFMLTPLTVFKKPLSKKKDPNTPVLKTKAETSQIALLANGAFAKSFVKNLFISTTETPEYIVYGNSDFGFFKTKSFVKKNNSVELELIPPTYTSPIDVCVKYPGQKLKWSLQKSFTDPKPIALKNIRLNVEGDFTNDFFLIAAQFVPDESAPEGRAFIPVIANKFGELVWAHMPQNGKTSFKKYPTIKQIKPGEYGIMFGEKYSYFEHLDYKGNILDFVFPKEAQEPYIVHHDFVSLSDSKILTLGHKLHYLRNFLSLQKDFINPMISLQKPTRFLSTTVELVDLKANTHKVLWDPIDHFNPLDSKTPWARTEKELALNLSARAKHFYQWGKNRAQVDWTHANTIEYYPGVGILVSLRNLSKVILLDEKTYEVLWTLGNDRTDTFQTLNEKHSFYHQHHVQILKGGYIMMMDNHSTPPAPESLGS
jgi:hypothetical protein